MERAKRERVLHMRMTKDEKDRLEDLSKFYGLSMSDTVRMLIRAAHKKRVGRGNER